MRSADRGGAAVDVDAAREVATLHERDFVAREMTLIGSEYFAYHELSENFDLLQANRQYLSQIITHRLGVDEIQHAFELFFAGETGKVIIEQ